jgi:HSP20 family protein
MALIPFKPIFDMDRFFDDDWIKSMDNESQLIKAPKMDVYETEKDIVAEIEIPGIDPKNIDIEVGETSLKIEAKKEEKKEEKAKGYFKKELSSGYYKRIVSLPGEIIKEKTNASYSDGMLKVIMPKVKNQKENKKGVKVKIK